MPKRMKLKFGGNQVVQGIKAKASSKKGLFVVVGIVVCFLCIAIIGAVVYYEEGNGSGTSASGTSASGTPSTDASSGGSSSTSSGGSSSTSSSKPYALHSSITGKSIFEPDPTLGSGYISGCPTIEYVNNDKKTRSDSNKRYNVASSDPNHSNYNDNIYVGIAMNGGCPDGGPTDDNPCSQDGTGPGSKRECAQSITHIPDTMDPCSQIVKNTESSESLNCNKFYYYNRLSARMMPCKNKDDDSGCIGHVASPSVRFY